MWAPKLDRRTSGKRCKDRRLQEKKFQTDEGDSKSGLTGYVRYEGEAENGTDSKRH
jgi:hypothetical protein